MKGYLLMVDSKKIIVALDYNDINDALKLSDNIDSNLCRIKIGKELFTKYGPKIVRDIQARGFEVFLDLKFHDIPTTVARACFAASQTGAEFISLHTCAGIKALKMANEAAHEGARAAKENNNAEETRKNNKKTWRKTCIDFVLPVLLSCSPFMLSLFFLQLCS